MKNRQDHFFKTIARINRAIYRGRSADMILQMIAENITALFHSSCGCTLRVLNRQSNLLELQNAFGMSPQYLAKGPVRAVDGLCEIYEKAPVVIRDIAEDLRVQYPEDALAEGIVSIVGLPLKIMGDMRMVLRIYLKNEIDLAPHDILFLNTLAEQCAIAAQNTIFPDRYLDIFRKVSSAIHSGHDTLAVLQAIVTQITEEMAAKGSIFWIIDNDTRKIKNKITCGFTFQSLAAVDFKTLKDIFVTGKGGPVHIRDCRYDPRLPDLERLGKKQIVSVTGIPFKIVDQLSGILAVYFSHEKKLTPRETKFLQALAEQGAISLHKALRYDDSMLQAFRETIEGLVLALEAKDICTHGHSIKVAHYARMTAIEMGLSTQQIENVYHAGLLHDIGKIGMEDGILFNLGKLSLQEYEIIQKHPVIGARILKPLSFMNDIIPLILNHHERFNGSGYPQGKKAGDIPMGARILAVCDSFDAMISERPNMKKIKLDKALSTLRKQAGIFFDPTVVTAFIAAITKNPSAVKPFELPENYFTKYRNELKSSKINDLTSGNMLTGFTGGI